MSDLPGSDSGSDSGSDPYGGVGGYSNVGGAAADSMGDAVVVPMGDSLDGDGTYMVAGTQPLWPLLKAQKFPAAAWDPALQAQIILAEFAGYKWREKLDPVVQAHMWPKDWVQDFDRIQTDVNQLLELRQQRAAFLGEIVAQAEDLAGYWAQMLMVTPKSHPATWMLISGAMAIGHMVGMWYKVQENRPRPVQLYPSLMPVITTPSHASFPNNHMLQSGLIANLIGRACDGFSQPADALANRIGWNRLIAGLHYPSDFYASVALSDEIGGWIGAQDAAAPFPLLLQTVANAREEFGNPAMVPRTEGPKHPGKDRKKAPDKAAPKQ